MRASRRNTKEVSWFEGKDIDLGTMSASAIQLYNPHWKHGETKKVKYFAEYDPVDVTLLSVTDPSLESSLLNLVDGDPIALDLEWRQGNGGINIPVNVYQLCTTKGCLVVHDVQEVPPIALRNFLSSSSGNKFISKGCGNDRINLMKRFGEDFVIDMEDVERSRLAPYGHSLNFVQMVRKFAGEPLMEIKNKRVTMSCWNNTELSVKQVLYAAFDVVSLYKCIPNFPEARPYREKPSKVGASRRPKHMTLKYLRNSLEEPQQEIEESEMELLMSVLTLVENSTGNTSIQQPVKKPEPVQQPQKHNEKTEDAPKQRQRRKKEHKTQSHGVGNCAEMDLLISCLLCPPKLYEVE